MDRIRPPAGGETHSTPKVPCRVEAKQQNLMANLPELREPRSLPLSPFSIPAQNVVYATATATATLTPIASVAGSEIRLEYELRYREWPVWNSLSFVQLGTVVRLRSKLILILFDSDAYELTAGAHAGLLEQALQDCLHIALRDLELPRDLLVRKALEHEAHHLSLP